MIARIDRNFGNLQKVTFTVNESEGFQNTPDIYPTAGNPGRPDRSFSDRKVELADTVNLTPNLAYHASFEVDSNIIDTISLHGDSELPAQLGSCGVGGEFFPALRFRGYVGLGSSRRSYLRNAFKAYDFDNELIFHNGGHTWTVVSCTKVVKFSTLELDSPSGSFSFNDRITGLPGINNTGDGFATFLLGQARRAEATDQFQPA